MNPRRQFWLEKLQVQTAGALIAVVGYFVLWPILGASDPQGALSFLVDGGVSRLMSFALFFWVLAIICGVVTISARPVGAMVGLLLGTVGFAFRSPQIRSLLWDRLDTLSGLYGTLIAEILILGGVLIVGWIIVIGVRHVIGKLLPDLIWKDPRSIQRDAQKLKHIPEARGWRGLLVVVGLSTIPAEKTDSNSKGDGQLVAQQWLLWAGSQLVIAGVLLWALMRSADRGQVLFALAASFFCASLISNIRFPNPYGMSGWVFPIVLAVCLYVLAGYSAIGEPPQGWIEVATYGRALPIDWLTAGCGGSMLGYWVSFRICDERVIQAQP